MNNKQGKHVSFTSEVQYLLTYSSQEYDRGLSEDLEEKEAELEEQIERLNILIVETNYENLARTSLVDYHIMLAQLSKDEEPLCDFGIFVSSKCEDPLQFGDMLIALNEEDLLETTAGQVKVMIGKLERDRNHQVTLGRGKSHS